jgi:hypothetical protein
MEQVDRRAMPQSRQDWRRNSGGRRQRQSGEGVRERRPYRRPCVDQEEEGELAQRPQLKNTGLAIAANDHEQMSSEGGTASMKMKKASKPSGPYHVLAGTGLFAANAIEQFTSAGGTASEGGNAGSNTRQQRLM